MKLFRVTCPSPCKPEPCQVTVQAVDLFGAMVEAKNQGICHAYKAMPEEIREEAQPDGKEAR
jgi:hypothetical protein